MKATTNRSYGSPDVLSIEEVARPIPGDSEILVEVFASPVTQGDRRLRSADFPGISSVFGRLMMGVRRPKNVIPGTMFSGRVVAVGPAVTRFVEGEDVFGSCDHSAHAEYLTVAEDGNIAHMPASLSHAEAAAVPYGAVTALLFLRDHTTLVPGQHVLVLGAAGGVGRFAVQIARHMGAKVTGVCSARDAELVRQLGAHEVLDYASIDYASTGERYDVIFDTPDVSSFQHARGALTQVGRYLSLHLSMLVLFQMLFTSLRKGPRAIFGLAFGTQADLEQVRDLVQIGAITPVVARCLPMAQVAQAHSILEDERPSGAVMLTMATAEPALRLAQ
ncbi:MAG: NADPH:quinone reductase-like Zn-dependent oxidoreductase [Myxococcota bacterium]|jgi:NADPH:quinone reductase-like Zn-dependent oxidoreductase